MPIYIEISRLHRIVTIVARGKIASDEVRGMAQQLADARIHSFAKVVDVTNASGVGDLTPEQIAGIALLLRGDGGEKRGPLAFIVDPEHDDGFSKTYAKVTEKDGPVSLFRSLREARAWLDRIQHMPAAEVATAPRAPTLHAPTPNAPMPAARRDPSPWTDPQRRGLLLRGGRQRHVTVRSLVGA